MADENKPKVVFLTAPGNEKLTLEQDFKVLARHLSFKFHVSSVDNLALISPNETIAISAGMDKLGNSDIEILKKHRAAGGSLFFMVPSANSPKISADLAGFLAKSGVSLIKYDAVIQQTYTPGLYHPTHVSINSQSFLNASLATKIEKQKQTEDVQTDLQIVYPNGCYFQIQQPAIPIISSGEGAFPVQQPILMCHELKESRMLLMGTAEAFNSEWIKKFDNKYLAETLFSYLAKFEEAPILNQQVKDTAILDEQSFVPDTQILSSNLRACLHQPDPLPEDFRDLLSIQEQKKQLLPQIVKLYEKMGFPKTEPILRLIKPSFERPTPPLVPAVHAPQLPEPPGCPQLELFDLDTELASDITRLTRLALMYKGATDLEIFVKRAGEIFALNGTPKEILYQVLKVAVQFKKPDHRGK
ncbi:Intraflagellar_transport protein 52 [Hexamita inflata]|uniref:Intraflagellar transport protein 52 n=1 Tax=Hexamita inflata TaxID=28002 RepID=A0AA86PIW3_9EUKA|nr:Intraflagellar transport protein 52 [Hexamita inflata]